MPTFQVLDECAQLRVILLKFSHFVDAHCIEKIIVLVVVVKQLLRQLGRGSRKTIGVTVLGARLVEKSHVKLLLPKTPASLSRVCQACRESEKAAVGILSS